MKRDELEKLLKKVQTGETDIETAVRDLESLPFSDIGFAMIDNHRDIRTGFPEVIYGQSKTTQQIEAIARSMDSLGKNVLITRVGQDAYDAVSMTIPKAVFNPIGRTISIINNVASENDSYIAIVAAGTSDLPVVEEAYETCRLFGSKAVKVVDVGVAGIHRLFSKLEIIRGAKVVIVVAGMEGALASVVGGLVSAPVIAVPTSVGYGASFSGISALLTMLNSCASGVTVVNIDNGFGAAYAACMIDRI